MPKKVRELKQMLRKEGFTLLPKRGKGSHTVWTHPLYNGSITVLKVSGCDRYNHKRNLIMIFEPNKIITPTMKKGLQSLM